jgi:CPA2 family monovalent cation:H+ antiporter-2
VRCHNEEEAQLLQRELTGRVFVGESELARSITDYVLQRVA